MSSLWLRLLLITVLQCVFIIQFIHFVLVFLEFRCSSVRCLDDALQTRIYFGESIVSSLNETKIEWCQFTIVAVVIFTLITTTLHFRLQRILPDADVFNAIYFVFIDAFCFWSVAKCDIFLAWWSNKGLQKKENETTANLILRYK